MDKKRRKELVQQYKQMKVYMGVYKITNTVNKKIYIGTCPNLKNKWLTIKMQLDMGRFPNSELQKDWNEYGQDAFTYEVIDKKEVEEDMDKRWELKKMEKAWLQKSQSISNLQDF